MGWPVTQFISFLGPLKENSNQIYTHAFIDSTSSYLHYASLLWMLAGTDITFCLDCF
jgi:hypothetical protein